MTRALTDIAFAGIAGMPLLFAIAAYSVSRLIERPRKPICGLQYEFTTAPLIEHPDWSAPPPSHSQPQA